MNLTIRIIIAAVILCGVSFVYYRLKFPAPPTAAQLQEAAKTNSHHMRTEYYDGHVFIVVRGSEGPSGLVHHPGCHCLQRIPDPSILEHVQGRQYIPNNGGILER